jgi:hypothetical protein
MPHMAPYSLDPGILPKRTHGVSQFTSYVPLLRGVAWLGEDAEPIYFVLSRVRRARILAAHSALSSCGTRETARASAGTSLVMTLPEPI